jgi:hypothetical protein
MSAETYKRKIFKIAVAACAATVLSAGYALDSTRHFLFRAREPVNQWALGDRTAHTNVGRGDLDHLHPRERRSPGEYPLCVDVGVAGRPVDYRAVLARARY